MKQSVRKKGYSYICYIGQGNICTQHLVKATKFYWHSKEENPQISIFKNQEARKLNFLSNKPYIYINQHLKILTLGK